MILLIVGSKVLGINPTIDGFYDRVNIKRRTLLSIVVRTENSTCQYSNGWLAIKVSGGTAPYKYWLNNAPVYETNIFGYLSAGDYMVHVQDANGVTDSVLATVGNTLERPELTFWQTPISATCFQRVTMQLKASGGTPPYLYSSDNINFTTNPDFPNFPSFGNYVFSVKDANGCNSFFYGTTLTSSCFFDGAGSAAQYVCGNSGGIEVKATAGGVPPYQYSLDSVNWQSNPSFRGIGPGLHHYYTKDAQGKTQLFGVNTVQDCKIKITSLLSDASCNGNGGKLVITTQNAEPPIEYSIDGFNFQSSNIFTNLTAGPYAIIVKDSRGKNTVNVATIKSTCPVISATIIPASCESSDGQIAVSTSGGASPYLYSINGQPYQSDSSFKNLSVGEYNILVKDAQGYLDSVTLSITSRSCFAVTAMATNTTCGLNNGGILATALKGKPPYTYSIDSVNFLTSNTFSNLAGGSYTIYAKDQENTIVKTDVSIAGSLPLLFNLGSDTVQCEGKPLLLRPDSTFNSVTYLWSTGQKIPSIAVSTTGLFFLTITDAKGCNHTDSVNVNFKSLPKFTLGKDTSVCDNQAMELKVTIGGIQEFLWSTGERTSSIKAISPGEYWCEVVKDGCKFIDSIIISSKQTPKIFLGNDTTLCNKEVLTLNVTTNNASYLWQDGSTRGSYVVSKSGIYSVVVNQNDCSVSDSILVNYQNSPKVDLGNDTSLCAGQTYVLSLNFVNSSYLWQDGSTNSDLVINKPGVYWGKVENFCGSDIDSIKVLMGSCDIFMPSSFSPNGDGLNDRFKILNGTSIKSMHLSIYDRFGNKVFETTNKVASWDGKYKGALLPQGVYVWTLDYSELADSAKKQKRGSLVLIR